MILISACLLGRPVRYSGDAKPCELILRYKDCGRFLPLCPECAALLPIPRPPAEIHHADGGEILSGKAKVYNQLGSDITAEFLHGAEKILRLIKNKQVTAVIFKERSPSCGVHQIYDGSFTGKVTDGQGVTAALLRQHGYVLYSEEDLTEELLEKLIEQDKKSSLITKDEE